MALWCNLGLKNPRPPTALDPNFRIHGIFFYFNPSFHETLSVASIWPLTISMAPNAHTYMVLNTVLCGYTIDLSLWGTQRRMVFAGTYSGSFAFVLIIT